MAKTTRIAFFLFLLLSFQGKAQDVIQWASKLDFQYNQFGDVEYSGNEALGAPNAKPYGSINPRAFRMLKEASFGTLVVTFANPQAINHLIVIESHLPGRITEIALIDTKEKKNVIHKANSSAVNEPYRVLLIPVPSTNYLVRKIEININSISAPGWTQIDAVGICQADVKAIAKELSRYGDFDLDVEVTFSSEKKNLGKNINTTFVETKPIISPDGKTLYFHRQNYPENVKGEKDDQDIYLSKLEAGNWSKAVNAGSPFNDKYPNGIGAVTPDGNTAILLNAYDEKGNISPGVSYSKRLRNGWSAPKKLEIKNFSNDSEYQDFYLANNGRVLISAIQRKDSYGDQDLYVSFAVGQNQWSEPINMGPILNTSRPEFSPFLAADNKTLYFASEGHKGQGGSDIYYSKRLDETWKNWTKPKNLGTAVNSKDWDAYYAISAAGDLAYFVSTQGAMGGSRDIYSISLPSEFKPEPVLLVKGRVLDQKTNLAIEAEIIISSLPEGAEEGVANSAPYSGEFQLVLPQGKNYSLRASAPGYVSVEQNLKLEHIDEYKEIEQTLFLAPIEVGQTVVLNNVYFEQGKSTLLSDSYPELDRLATLMKENASMTIELGGHTDNQGIGKSNLELSEQRVQVVKQFLVNKGVESKRVSTKAYGGIRPIAPNTNEEGRAKNRRVDMTIISF